jgi:hypothetical protein
MKKLILLGMLAVVFASCKSTSATNTKVDNKSQMAMKGNWAITSVSYPGSEYIKVTSFGIADSKCFEGSTWKLISNNDKGTMALNKVGCPSYTSDIRWFVNKEGQFVLKILDDGLKAKKVKDGYVLGVSGQTDQSFQLVDKIDVGGKMTNVVYQFQKIN